MKGSASTCIQGLHLKGGLGSKATYSHKQTQRRFPLSSPSQGGTLRVLRQFPLECIERPRLLFLPGNGMPNPSDEAVRVWGITLLHEKHDLCRTTASSQALTLA